ncbi:MAG: hypothetical protein MZV64_32725 [Ignavibacteriales bacterium]|nr:hypothetical protein [Ignavibacteriales bacterium]
MHRQRGAGRPGPEGRHGRRRGRRESRQLGLHVRLPLTHQVHVLHRRQVRRPEGPVRPGAPGRLCLFGGHGFAAGPARSGRRHPRFLRTGLRPFPYEKLGIVLRLWPAAGGHSPASFIVLNELPWFGDAGFPTPVDTPVDLSGWDEYFLAHEIAHQWWGQGVSFETHKDQWLSEGLAQFASASYLRHQLRRKRPYAAILKKFSRWTVRKTDRGPILMGSRLSYFDYEAYQAIVYDKAALALFMLQDLLGREAFEAGLRSFFEKKKFGPARTGEFVRAMESASGRDLKSFFRGWFESWRLPQVRTVWTETVVPEGVRVDFRVTQIEASRSSSRSGSRPGAGETTPDHGRRRRAASSASPSPCRASRTGSSSTPTGPCRASSIRTGTRPYRSSRRLIISLSVVGLTPSR